MEKDPSQGFTVIKRSLKGHKKVTLVCVALYLRVNDAFCESGLDDVCLVVHLPDTRESEPGVEKWEESTTNPMFVTLGMLKNVMLRHGFRECLCD